ncbi:MAG: HutD family protein [Hydrogenophaga sp.]|uniref:HutD/Ves family protein n=1 Tax=Hydrogenophaga sp. TaxID=1904254 RepID=UPI00272FE201|nr:HutD family protein [Hydrogenophaga sp.]MDP2406840.1 HutD family protein [Hydrogenophaga sp.]MDZ4174476.1 HutD family protein [Hydrogenophaga sp.]
MSAAPGRSQASSHRSPQGEGVPVNRAPTGCFAQRHFTLQALPREAWKNQGGWTRPVASAVGHDGQTDWRVSAAEITTAGPFSIFEGLDRQAVMLQGGRLRLRASQPVDDIHFDGPGSMAAFPGERRLTAEKPAGPTVLWNVMHRRGVVRAEVGMLGDRVMALPPTPHVLLYVLSGEVEIALPRCRTQGLGAGHGLHLQQLPAQTLLAPGCPGSQVLVTAIYLHSALRG